MEQNHFCISSFSTITKKRNCITPNRALSSPPSLGSAAWDPLIPESGKPLHRNKASLSSLLFQHDIIQVGGWILLWMLVCYETAQLYIYIYFTIVLFESKPKTRNDVREKQKYSIDCTCTKAADYGSNKRFSDVVLYERNYAKQQCVEFTLWSGSSKSWDPCRVWHTKHRNTF